MNKNLVRALVLAVLFAGWAGGAARGLASQDQNEKTKSSRDSYPLIVETDLYCSFFVLERAPGARILAPSAGEKLLLTDGDQFYGGPVGDWHAGQILQLVELGPDVVGVKGQLVYGRGRAKIVRIESDRFLAQIEKSCGPVRIGNGLLPFEKKTVLLGKDLGFGGTLRSGDVLTGRIVFLPDDHDQAGANSYVLIDRGLEAGLQIGQQLTVFGAPEGIQSPRAIGNAVVISAGKSTATIKLLSVKDIVRRGDLVQAK
jgi:hypothetical protein